MADSYIQVAPDGTGKRMQTYLNTVSGLAVEAEAVVLVDETGSPLTALLVTGPLTDTQLRATPVEVDGSGVTQPVSGTFWQATQPVSGTFFQATQPVSGPLTDAQLRAVAVPVSGTFWQATQPVSVASTLATKETRSATATTSQVADTASNATLLALNANRLGATIENDSSAVLYVKLGTTATTTDYTVRMVQYAYYEVPFGYTGRIDGIWSSDPGDGAARITELS